MFLQSPKITFKNVFFFSFCTRRTDVFDKILCTTHVIKCPLKSTIPGRGDAKILRKEVESVASNMQYTCLMGDACFNNILDKNI